LPVIFFSLCFNIKLFLLNDALNSRYSVSLQMLSLVLLFHKKSDVIAGILTGIFSQNHLADVYIKAMNLKVVLYFAVFIVFMFIATNSYLNILPCNKGDLLKPLK